MNFEQFEKADAQKLKREAKACFDSAMEMEGGAWERREARIVEAQFHMQEMDRRHDSTIALRDLILEVIVILLIGWEIYMGYQQDAVLTSLSKSMEMTRTGMQSVNERMVIQIARTTQGLLNVTGDMAKGSVTIFDGCNFDMTYWGYQFASEPAVFAEKPIFVARNGTVDIPAAHLFAQAAATKSGRPATFDIRLFLKDDVGTEFVAESSIVMVMKDGSVSGLGGNPVLRFQEWNVTK